MEARNSAQVDLIGVCKRYDEHVAAVNEVSLTIVKGQFIALMGPSGCGKSTLLNLVGGIDKPTTGKIVIDGEDITGFDEGRLTLLRREKIGFVFQSFNLLFTLTVRENIELPLELAGALPVNQIRQKCDALLAEVGLSERADFYPQQLSGGEMQRVAILRAVIHSPQIILADEPTGNLDSDNGKRILEMLQKLSRQRGETILMATHSPEAANYADAIIHMKDGRIVDPVRI